MQFSGPAPAHIAQHSLVVPPQATSGGLVIYDRLQCPLSAVWMLRSSNDPDRPSEPPFW